MGLSVCTSVAFFLGRWTDFHQWDASPKPVTQRVIYQVPFWAWGLERYWEDLQALTSKGFSRGWVPGKCMYKTLFYGKKVFRWTFTCWINPFPHIFLCEMDVFNRCSIDWYDSLQWFKKSKLSCFSPLCPWAGLRTAVLTQNHTQLLGRTKVWQETLTYVCA